jgi:hypothetical protein
MDTRSKKAAARKEQEGEVEGPTPEGDHPIPDRDHGNAGGARAHNVTRWYWVSHV